MRFYTILIFHLILCKCNVTYRYLYEKSMYLVPLLTFSKSHDLHFYGVELWTTSKICITRLIVSLNVPFLLHNKCATLLKPVINFFHEINCSLIVRLVSKCKAIHPAINHVYYTRTCTGSQISTSILSFSRAVFVNC